MYFLLCVVICQDVTFITPKGGEIPKGSYQPYRLQTYLSTACNALGKTSDLYSIIPPPSSFACFAFPHLFISPPWLKRHLTANTRLPHTAN